MLVSILNNFSYFAIIEVYSYAVIAGGGGGHTIKIYVRA
jgi:hypothetical protein